MRNIAPLVITAAMLCLAAPVAAAPAADHRLAEAAKNHDFTTVRTLLRQPTAGAEVNVPLGDGATALQWAAHWDEVDVANLLLRAGAKPDAADDNGVTAIWLACLNGSTAMVNVLLETGANANAATVVGETPLMMAAHTGNVEVVRLLLEHGANVAAAEKTLGQTALMRAIADNHADSVRLLLEKGADVKVRSKNKFTPLLFAAQQGNVEIARLLLRAGASVNESAPDGIAGDTNALSAFKANTDAAALLVAIDSHQEAMAAFLLENGADPNLHGAGRTALHSAVQQSMPTLVKALLAHGADPNARLEKTMPLLSRFITQATGLEINTVGATPFWLAASYGDVPSMRLLVEGGADPKLASNDKTTPLMVAAGVDFVEGQDKYGRRWFQLDTTLLQTRAVDAMQYCLELGNDVNAANDKGQTALHGAVYFGGTRLVPFLVEHGAKMNVLNARQQTPWIITQGEYQAGSFIVHKETGAVLEKLGADIHMGGDIGREAALAALAASRGR